MRAVAKAVAKGFMAYFGALEIHATQQQALVAGGLALSSSLYDLFSDSPKQKDATVNPTLPTG